MATIQASRRLCWIGALADQAPGRRAGAWTAPCLPEPTAPTVRQALRGISARRELTELLDRPDVDARALAGNLRDLRLMNRWLGWSHTVGAQVERLMRARGLSSATLLDVATGSADIPRAVITGAARHGRTIRAVATDISAPVLTEARRTMLALRPLDAPPLFTHSSAEHRSSLPVPPLAFVQHDATHLPFRDRSFDIATLCLAAHHLAPAELVQALAELGRVSRHGVIVSDLVRGPLDYLLARLMALVLRNPLTAHDGPVSVLRAYTPAELHALARRAGLRPIRLRRSFPTRMTLVARPGSGATTALPHH